MKLLVVIPFHSGDITLARNLIAWIEELGSLPDNVCLLMADAKLKKDQIEPLAKAAQGVFAKVFLHAPPFALPEEKWPIGANWMFENAALWIEKNQPDKAWLWLEPDAVPMPCAGGWLAEIERGHAAAKKPFFGQIIRPNQTGLPPQMLSGVAVYPPRLPRVIFQRLLQTKREIAWDVACAPTIVPLTANSPLFWNFHNQKMPPTFVRKRTKESPVNALELARIPKQAVLAHTCKDGSLISILRGDGEPDLGQLYMMWRLQWEAKSPGPEVWTPRREPLRFIHCVERHFNGDMEALRRSTNALKNWTELYKTGQLVPAHLWEPYPRDSREIKDARGLPFLKDVLVEGMTLARPDDVIVLTNDDTVLHARVLEAIEEKLRTVDACGSFRLNFKQGKLPGISTSIQEAIQLGEPDLGRDLYAFKKSWLKTHWFNLPDFFLGELEWDLVMAVMVRRSAGIFTDRKNILEPMPICEIERGYVWHEEHEKVWTSPATKQSPAKHWNKRLAIEFYARNGFPSLISTF